MCKRGTTEVVGVRRRNSPRPGSRKLVDVDACIAPLVRALNHGGIATVASCCGHGIRPGNVALRDGRELLILPSYELARLVDKLFPPLAE